MAENWGDDELAAAVNAYANMVQLEAEQRTYSKRQVYRDLAAKFGRTEKAFEYRMQNISAVLQEMGEPWLPGLKPAGNVGANVKPRIMSLLDQASSRQRPAQKKEAPYRAKLAAIRAWLIQVARDKRTVTYGQVMEVFDIDRFSLRHAMDYLGHQADNRDEPIITALIVGMKTQRCSQGLAKEFDVVDDAAERRKLYTHWGRTDDDNSPTVAEPDTLDVKAARFVSVESRPDQAAFRRRVYLACKGACVISGCTVLKALDAAHKHGRDWKLGHNTASDGYLMRKDLHALYDNHLLWISDDGKVVLHSSVMEHYKQFAGAKLIC
ncbi:HNH endonuclease signature motif containing protein [Burkholderia gladioli]|uniref:HNH endonuclease signature motif containing protein n=1 Tax=Burkholderia gladioli TaxID=28095 RepID=UPI001640EAB8|nr:HNH endonuclease signature motif containing protein [Burkholderia gladioli]